MAKIILIFWTVGVLCMVPTQAQKADNTIQNSILSTLINTFIKPYLDSFNIGNVQIDRPVFRTGQKIFRTKAAEEFTIEGVIKKKMDKLKPFLQDDDHMAVIDQHENNTNSEANDTTIIEFTPAVNTGIRAGKPTNHTNTLSLEKTVNKYKGIKKQLNTMMENEKISSEIKNLVMNTLDGMITHMVASRCSWKTNQETPDQTFQRQNVKTRKAITRLYNMTNNQWTDLKGEFAKYLEKKHTKEVSFIDQFQEFFQTLLTDHENATKIPDEYKIQCKLVQYKNPQETQFRAVSTETKPNNDMDSKCAKFKLCSEELDEFLNKLYGEINDTSVSIFKNYAAMYQKDVNTNVNKEAIDLLNKLSTKAEAKVSKIFLKNLGTFHVDKNKEPRKNIRHLRRLITDTTCRVNRSILKLTKKVLNADESNRYKTIIDDLAVNTKLDFSNMETDLLDSVCKTFYICNGKYLARRRMNSPEKDSFVLVKMKVNLDDDIKHALRDGDIFRPWEKYALNKLTSQFKNKSSGDYRKRYNKFFHITRTTHANTSPIK